MLQVLVVEDNQEKLRHILSVLTSTPGCSMDGIDCAHDSIEAKKLLEETPYDLLIMDISLPERPEDPPSPEGGIRLLEEIVERAIYLQPREIVGLTAYPDIRDKASVRFSEDLWLVVQYDPTSDGWREQLARKVRHILVSKRSEQKPEFMSDLCIVTALLDPELSAVLNLKWGWKVHETPYDGSVYYEGQYLNKGASKSVYAVAAPRMGMSSAAIATSKLVYTFRPRYLCMVGITAGIKGECNIGDIIVADPSWDYGSGKYTVKDKEVVFSAAPHQVGLDSFIRGKIGLLSRDHTALSDIQVGWQGTAPKTTLSLHIGPVASGSAVRQDGVVAAEIKKQHRKALGIEMETYGVYSAVSEAPIPQPKVFSFKAVSDFADRRKKNDFQPYAAYASANAMRLLVEKYL
jgi:nucleoside phosphorylase/CheY-like chemotaxis protein